MRQTLIPIRLQAATPNAVRDLRSEHSWILTAVSRVDALLGLAAVAEGSTKGPGIEELFSEVHSTNGEFALEVALELPNWLPSIGVHQEYHLDVAVADGTLIHMCVSNHMIRARYSHKGTPMHALLPAELVTFKEAAIPENAYVEHLRTMVSARFVIAAPTAEHAVEENVERCVDVAIEAANHLVSAKSAIVPDELVDLTPVMDRGTFPYVYVAVGGNDPAKVGCLQYFTNFYRAQLNPPVFAPELAQPFTEVAREKRPTDDVGNLLRSGKSYFFAGLLEFGFLQLVFACEMATARFVQTVCVRRGVSKAKLDGSKQDITFSMSLNVIIPSMGPPRFEANKPLFDRIDLARRIRNKLVHENKFGQSRESIARLIEDAYAFCGYLAEATTEICEQLATTQDNRPVARDIEPQVEVETVELAIEADNLADASQAQSTDENGTV